MVGKKDNENKQVSKVGENTEMQISLKWFVQILVVVALAVWGYFGITERINFLEHEQEIASINVNLNSEFRVKWPRGELGALPDDAEQNMRLDMLEKIVDKMEDNIQNMKEELYETKYEVKTKEKEYNLGIKKEAVERPPLVVRVGLPFSLGSLCLRE